jgi:uncharacterized protein (DUF2147 family)
MFDMKALCIATTLALLGGSAAHAGTILDTAIGGSDARLKVEDCGNDTCGTVSFGKQKFVVKKSDIFSFFKDLDLGDKPSPAKQRDKPAATGNRARPTGAAPAAGPEDRNASSSRRDEPAAIRSDDRPAPRWDETPGPAPDSAAAAIDQKGTIDQKIPAPPAASDPNSPIGEWITEGGEGRVRITACGQALCGVVAGGNPNDTDRHNPDPAKRNRPMDGMTVLIDMKPAKSNHWEGQIYNAKDGRTYASNISLKNADVLRVEGCVFGGLFCGGQNWTRAKDARQG